MRDPSHDEFIVRWARFVANHPTEWKRHHTPFINAQIELASRFYENLGKTEEGRKILQRLRDERKVSGQRRTK